MTLLTTQPTANMGDIAPLIAALVVLFLIIFFCTIMFVKTSQMQKKLKQERQEQKNKRQASLVLTMTHVNGLPIAENVSCTVYSTPERYEIEAQGNTFNLSKDKVTDVSIKTDTEITKQYVSSVGGAVGGAVLFGPLGAIIGGRAKQKKSKETHKYLIITYESEGQIKYVGFDVTVNFKAYDLVNEFALSGKKHTATVDL